MDFQIIKKAFFTILFFLFGYFQSQEKVFIDLIFNNKSNFEILKIFGGKIPKRFLVLDKTAIFYENNFHLSLDELSEPEKSDEHSRFLNTYIFRNENLNKLITEDEKVKLGYKARNSICKNIFKIPNDNVRLIHDKKMSKNFSFQLSETLYSSNKKYAFVRVDILKFDKFYLSEEDDGYYNFGTLIFIFKKDTKMNWCIFDKYEHLIM